MILAQPDKQDGPFHFRYSWEHESFIDLTGDDALDETLKKDVDSGELLCFWFVVEYRFEDITLATESVGQCLYSTIAEFLEGDYVKDLERNAKKDGLERLDQLAMLQKKIAA